MLCKRSIEPALVLNFPADGDILEPGKQYNITWTGVLIPSLSIVLYNFTDESTTVLAAMENTGTYYWQLPLSDTIEGQYQLSLVAFEQGLITPPVTFAIQDANFTGEPLIALQNITWSVISEGDIVTIFYTSEVGSPVLYYAVLVLYS